MKPTAVEWLMQTLEQNNIIDLDVINSDKYYTIIEQAKAIEKQQIYAAWGDGFYTHWGSSKMPDDYYNETFKSE